MKTNFKIKKERTMKMPSRFISKEKHRSPLKNNKV